MRGRSSNSDDAADVQNALLAIHSRLGTIEGKINLVARAEREKILEVLEGVIRPDPLLGQIYLLLDGSRRQRDIIELLSGFDISASQSTVSRRMDLLVLEYGVADPVGGEASRILAKNRAAEDVLNLSTRVRQWLTGMGETIPEVTQRRPRNRE